VATIRAMKVRVKSAARWCWELVIELGGIPFPLIFLGMMLAIMLSAVVLVLIGAIIDGISQLF
jgi:hypothetical protein